MYSVYDTAALAYTLPWYLHRREQAIRTFSNMCKDPEHQYNKNPEDFTLYYLGEYDDENGNIEMMDRPEALLKGVDVK